MASSGMFAGGQYLWDPLAAAAVVRPDVLTLARGGVSVVTTGAGAGRLVEDLRGAPVRLALGADRAVFERQFLTALIGRTRFAIPAPERRAVLRCAASGCSYQGPRRTAPGQGTFDTVNDATRPFTHLIGRLHEGRTAADLRRYVRAQGGTTPPTGVALHGDHGPDPAAQHDDVAHRRHGRRLRPCRHDRRTRRRPGWSLGSQSAPTAESVAFDPPSAR